MAEQPAAGRFDTDTAVVAVERGPAGGVYDVVVSPDWRAGRGPHGGYLTAIVLRALADTVDEPARSPRSITIHFPRAPRPGPATVRTMVERRGSSLTTLSARLEQDGRLCALALAAFSVPWRGGPEASELPMPDVKPPEQGAAVAFDHPLAPPFARFMTLQPRFGGMPLAGARQPMALGGWIGIAEPRPLDALALAFFADALMPSPFMRLAAPNPAPTIDLTVHFRVALPRSEAAPGELCLARVCCGVIHEGFFEEDTVIWAQDGTVLAQARQLALLLDAPMG